MVTAVYPYNPEPVHSRLQELFDKTEELKDQDQFAVIQILTDVAERNPQVLYSLYKEVHCCKNIKVQVKVHKATSLMCQTYRSIY